MQQLHAAYRDSPGVRVVGVSVDRDRRALTDFVAAHDIGWTVIYEDGKSWENPVARDFDVHRVPSLWLNDAEGLVRAIDLDPGTVSDAVEALLAGRPVATDSRPGRGPAAATAVGCSD